MLPVWMINCLEPDEYGVAQYCIPALMYIAQDEWTAPGMSSRWSSRVKKSLNADGIFTPDDDMDKGRPFLRLPKHTIHAYKFKMILKFECKMFFFCYSQTMRILLLDTV